MSSYDTAACHHHRESKNHNYDNVIVTFTTRKHVYEALRNEKKIQDSHFKDEYGNNLYVSENLCLQFRKILQYVL